MFKKSDFLILMEMKKSANFSQLFWFCDQKPTILAPGSPKVKSLNGAIMVRNFAKFISVIQWKIILIIKNFIGGRRKKAQVM